MNFGISFFSQILIAVLACVIGIRYLRKRRRAGSAFAERNTQNPIGMALAEKIADRLEEGLRIAYRHRDFCGPGLAFIDGQYLYDWVHDGQFQCENSGADKASAEHVFHTREAFVNWLASQSTKSLSEDQSQPLTRARLEKALWFCENQPKDKWGNYAG